MFLAYDFGDLSSRFGWDYDRFFYERWCREAVVALRDHPERTEDPERADYFVVTSSIRTVPFAVIDQIETFIDPSSQPYIGTGKPHVVFDLRDDPRPIVHHPQAIVCKSAFHQRFYNPLLGVPIPQFPRCRFYRPIVPALERRFLAGFKGNPRPEYGDLRQRLLALNDDVRLLFKGDVLKRDQLEISSGGNIREIVAEGDWTHQDILFDSTFAILPRASGYALSYRMIESMNAGCIPVILSDGYVLPFSDTLDYDCFSIRIAESEVENLPEILESRIGNAAELQRNAIQVYEDYFASTNTIIERTLECVAKLAVIRKKVGFAGSARRRLAQIGYLAMQKRHTFSPAELDDPTPSNVSIILAVHNVRKYLPASIESCLNQSFENIELILVDDSSDDGTYAICERYAKQFEQIRLLRNERNVGVYISRNRGFQAATGDYLCWHDGDDIMRPDRVRWQLRAIQKRDGAIASAARMRRMSKVGDQIVYDPTAPDSCCSTLFFHRSIFDRLGFFDSVRCMADLEYFNRFVVTYGMHRMVHVDAVVWDAWRRPNSLTTSQETGEGSPARLEYWYRFREWHKSGAKLFVSFPLDCRPFPAPDIFLPEKGLVHEQQS